MRTERYGTTLLIILVGVVRVIAPALGSELAGHGRAGSVHIQPNSHGRTLHRVHPGFCCAV